VQVHHVQTGHVANLARADFSGDGRHLLTLSMDGEAILWGVRDGRQIRTPGGIGEYRNPTTRIVELSPDGSQILMGRPGTAPDRVQLTLQSAASGTTLHTLRYSGDSFPDVGAFSRDGKYVCTIRNGHQGEQFHVWDAATGACVWSPEMPLPYQADRLEALKNEIESDEQRFDFSTVGNLSYLLFLRNVRPDGQPLTFARPLRMYNYTEASFSPDGRHFITRDWNDTGSSLDETALWDVGACKPVKKSYEKYDESNIFAFHPNGRSFIRGIMHKTAQLIDAQTGEEIRTFEGHEAEITCLAFAPDGSSVLTGDKDGVAIRWDVSTAKPLCTWPGHAGGVFSVAYHPDGDRVLFGCGQGVAIEYHAETGQQRTSVSLCQGGRRVRGVKARYSPDGRRILTRTVHDWHHPDWYAALWNAKTGLHVCTIGASPLGHLELSPNGAWAVRQPKPRRNTRADRRARSQSWPPLHLWDTQTGRRVHSFSKELCVPVPRPNLMYLHEASATPVQSSKGVAASLSQFPRTTPPLPRLTQDAREVFTTIREIDQEAIQWLNTWIEEKAPPPQKAVRSGFFLYAELKDGTLRSATWGGYRGYRQFIVRMIQGKVVCEYRAEALVPTAATLTQDGSRLVAAYREPLSSKDKARKTLIVWDTETGKRLRTIDVTQPDLAPSWDVEILTLSPDDRHLAMGYTYHIFLFDMTTERCSKIGRSGPYSVTRPMVLFSSDSRRVFLYGRRRTLWDIRSQKQLADLGAYNGVRRPLFSPNGKYLFAASSDHSAGIVGAMVWDCETGEMHRRLGNQAVALKFSPSGDRMVAFRGDMKIAELWDFDAGQVLCELSVPDGGSIVDAMFASNGERLITTHRKALALWDTASGEMLHSHIDETHPFEFYGNIQSPFFLDDGKRLVTVHRNGAVVWDVASGKPIHHLRAPDATRTSVIVGHEPNTLLTVSPGKNAILWDVESGQQRMVYDGMPTDIAAQINHVRFSGDGQHIFARHRAGQAVIAWDVNTGQVSQRLWLLNDGDDLLTELPQTGQFRGSPNAMKRVVVRDR